MVFCLFQTTGLTGLAVSVNPHHTLSSLYNKILRAVQKMPQEAAYRKYTEEIVAHRLKIVQSVSFSILKFSNQLALCFLESSGEGLGKVN